MAELQPLTPTNPFKRLFCVAISPLPQDPGCYSIAGDIVTIDLARTPELRVPGGALRLEDERLPDRILVMHTDDGRFLAYRNRCACGGFRIDPVPGQAKIKCCTPMQSAYDYSGKPISGSAKKDLDVLRVDGRAESVTVDVSSMKDTQPPHMRK